MITPEERAALRDPAAFSFCGVHAQAVRDVVNLLLDALEAEEARAEAAEKAVKALEEFPVALGDVLKRAEKAEAERDVLAGHLAEIEATCPGEWDECPFPDDCRVPPEKCTRC